ncbi:exported hypothetical protein [Agrobacterium tumefaciens str. B6]|uniref:Uncharacterized protein n=1 Tax=Agrobacterium tumefaciens str. B6 TaxID=1183423 RepID=A0A822V8R7_AGRTU|nr:exported hypothetical protein [Agrobacterium tumefaciens str. CFBP 5621]CVI22964.1 exported hypothetical protein [Agrobacterium tumefaciens str. B6]
MLLLAGGFTLLLLVLLVPSRLLSFPIAGACVLASLPLSTYNSTDSVV